jgi:hypothetical protein
MASRSCATGIHFAISLLVAGLAASLVFAVWYPGGLRLLSGGQPLFLLLVSIDVVLGPLLTAVVWNPSKSPSVVRRDVAWITALQLAALFYGLSVVAQVRPVVLAWEQHRLRIVPASAVVKHELPRAPLALQSLSWSGPRLIGTRVPQTGAEQLDAIQQGLQGRDVGMRPSFWLAWTPETARVSLARLNTASSNARKLPQLRKRVAELSRQLGEAPDNLLLSPVLGRLPEPGTAVWRRSDGALLLLLPEPMI